MRRLGGTFIFRKKKFFFFVLRKTPSAALPCLSPGFNLSKAKKKESVPLYWQLHYSNSFFKKKSICPRIISHFFSQSFFNTSLQQKGGKDKKMAESSKYEALQREYDEFRDTSRVCLTFITSRHRTCKNLRTPAGEMTLSLTTNLWKPAQHDAVR